MQALNLAPNLKQVRGVDGSQGKIFHGLEYQSLTYVDPPSTTKQSNSEKSTAPSRSGGLTSRARPGPGLNGDKGVGRRPGSASSAMLSAQGRSGSAPNGLVGGSAKHTGQHKSEHGGGIPIKSTPLKDTKDDSSSRRGSVDGGTSESSGTDTVISNDNEVITIHVCDESRKVNKDFSCRKDILLSEMKYFRSYLTGKNAYEDIDISVHCDVHIFEWLMNFLHKKGSDRPRLDTGIVVSILISSDFLQMESLVDLCLEYVALNINDIIKLPIDLNCLNTNLLSKLASHFTEESLEEVRDRKDKLVGRLYMKKLEEMLEDRQNALQRCVHCGKRFTLAQKSWMVCSKAKIFIDFHGNVIAEHVPDRNWDLNKFLLTLRAKKLSWRDIYWKIWGLVKSMHCTICNRRFIAAKLGHCTYHPAQPVFLNGENVGNYPCCGQQSLRFDTSIRKQGCCARNHVVKAGSEDSTALEVLLKRHNLVVQLFRPDDDDGEDSDQLTSGCQSENEDDDDENEGSGEEYGDDLWGTDDDSVQSDSDISSSGSDDDAAKQNTQLSRNRPRKFKRVPKKKKQRRGVSAEPRKMCPKKKRLLKLDMLRDDDERRMRVLIKMLEANRRDKDPKEVAAMPDTRRAGSMWAKTRTRRAEATMVPTTTSKVNNPSVRGSSRPPVGRR